MMIIIANGEISHTVINTPPDAIVIAVDGGALNCLKLGIFPNVVIGDFDSLSQDDILKLEKSGAEMIRYPVNKDETDLELALDYAVNTGVTKLTLFGLLGGRWDMSFANILLLSSSKYKGIHFHIINGCDEMFILRGGETIELNGLVGDIVSVIPLTSQTTGVTYSGLEWPLVRASLEFGSPRGVSNRLTSEIARIEMETGILLIVVTPQDNQLEENTRKDDLIY
jgi:thiamine pyrophosphokinase